MIRAVQKARKSAGLNVDDRIELAILADDTKLVSAVKGYAETIQAETLATKLADDLSDGDVHAEPAKANGIKFTVKLRKV